jgi:hypothetical protein
MPVCSYWLEGTVVIAREPVEKISPEEITLESPSWSLKFGALS